MELRQLEYFRTIVDAGTISGAARMLVETAEKSYMIAKSVGYSDPNYFSYVFKRQFGVSPSKYRTAYEKNEK